MAGETMKKILIILSIVVVLVVGCFFFLAKKEKLPNFIGQSLSEVETYCNKYSVLLKKEEVRDPSLKGTILSQDIKEGTVVKKGQTLRIKVSLGPMGTKEFQENKVNELGKVPIMMYHGIVNKTDKETSYPGGNVDKDGYQRTIESFRRDLEFYYQNGYRMISLSDYVDGNIDVPLGKSPIILTFDDGLENNLRVTGLDSKGEIIIDPTSAVGVLEEFKKKYPDSQVTATFFLNEGLFGQPEYNEKILSWLIHHGYEIGNHTLTHPDFTVIGKEETAKEVGGMDQKLRNLLKEDYVPIVALPFGSPYDLDHPNFSTILKGSYQGIAYTTKATLRVGWESETSPFSKNFDARLLKRIRAYDQDGKEFDIAMNFKMLEKTRYISDGDKNQIVIPKEEEKDLKSSLQKPVISY